ncbi:MAG TPA: hypothetical protein DCX27_07260 [Balneola sp.]|nr:hypothetical protein [Balneola sp.]|tara:strand:+ start:429 stop:905 length:477 start_codon:yes stop_codon:yes gene_type:complete
MKLLLENWRGYLKEFNPTGRQEGEIYIKSLPLDNPDLPAYTRAVGQDIRGVAKVFDVQGGEIKMEYIVPYSNSKGIYDIDNDARFEAIACVGHGEECLSHKLTDEQYDLAIEFIADLQSAADFIGTESKFLDTNPANYGFVNRNGRDELVMFDLGGEE